MASQNIQIDVTANALGVYNAIVQEASKAERQLRKRPVSFNEKRITGAFRTMTAEVERFDKSVERMTSVMQTFGQSAVILFGVQNAFKEMVKTTIEVEKRLTDISVVLGVSVGALSSFKKEMFEISKDTAQSFKDVADAATEFSRQGLGLNETLKRTKDAMILSRTTGMGAEEAVASLTATVNSFREEMIDTTKVVNTFRNVDTGFAVSATDLAEGIKRAGSSAASAKVSFNELNALITSLQETTARGGATIGNSLKSIFTRLQRDSVMKSLEEVGVATKEMDGSIRPAIAVLTDLARRMDLLSDAQKASVKETVAGAFQINALNALLSDLSAGYSTYAASLNVAKATSEEAYISNEKLNNSFDAVLKGTLASLQNFGSSVGDAFLGGKIKESFALLTEFLDSSNESIASGEGFANGVIQGIQNVFGGSGAVILSVVFGKIATLVARGAVSQLSSVLSISNESRKIADLQERIRAVLSSQDPVQQALINGAKTRADLESRILSIIEKENSLLKLRENLSLGVAQSLVRKGGSKSAKVAAGGYLPIGSESEMIKRGVGGAPSSAYPVVIKDFDYGGGKKGAIVANSSEVLVRDFMGRGDAIFNQDMIKKYGMPKGAVEIAAEGKLPPPRGVDQKNHLYFYAEESRLREELARQNNKYLEEKHKKELAYIKKEEAAREAARIEASKKFESARKSLASKMESEKIFAQNRAYIYRTQERIRLDEIRDRKIAEAQERSREARRLWEARRKRREDQQRAIFASVEDQANRSARMNRVMSGVGLASIAIPMLAPAITSKFSEGSSRDFANDVASSLGTALSGAFFGPWGLAATTIFGSAQLASSYNKYNLSKSLGQDGLSQNIDSRVLEIEAVKSSFREFQNLLDARNDALANGRTAEASEFSRKIIDLSKSIKSDELRKAMEEALTSTKELSEIQVDLSKVMRKYSVDTETNLSYLSAQKEMGDLIKKNSSFFGSANGISRDQRDLKILADTISKSVKLSDLTDQQKELIGNIAYGGSVPKDFFASLGLPELDRLYKASGESSTILQSLVAALVNGSLASEQYANTIDEIRIAQMNAQESASSFIKGYKISNSEKIFKDALKLESSLDLIEETINSLNISQLERDLSDSLLKKNRISQRAFSEANTVTSKFSDSILEKMAKSVGGGTSIEEMTKTIDSLVKKGELAEVIERLSSIEGLNAQERDLVFDSVSELKKIYSTHQSEMKKTDDLLKLQRFLLDRQVDRSRSDSLSDKGYVGNLAGSTKGMFGMSRRDVLVTNIKMANALNQTDRNTASGNLINNQASISRARIENFKLLKQGGFDPLSGITDPNQSNKERESLRGQYREDVKNVLLDDLKNAIIQQVETIRGEPSLKDFGSKSLDEFISKIQSSNDASSLRDVGTEFINLINRIAGRNVRSGLIENNGYSDLLGKGGIVGTVIGSLTSQANNMERAVDSYLSDMLGDSSEKELKALMDINETLKVKLSPLQNLVDKQSNFENFLKTRYSMESEAANISLSAKKRLEDQLNVRSLISRFNSPEILSDVASNNSLSDQIKNLVKGNDYSGEGWIPNTTPRDSIFKSRIDENDLFGQMTYDDLVKKYGEDRLLKLDKSIIDLIKQKKSLPSDFLDGSGNLIDLTNKNEELKRSLFSSNDSNNMARNRLLSIESQKNILSPSLITGAEAVAKAAERLSQFDKMINYGKVQGVWNDKDVTYSTNEQSREIFTQIERVMSQFSSIIPQGDRSNIFGQLERAVTNAQKIPLGFDESAARIDENEMKSIIEMFKSSLEETLKKITNQNNSSTQQVDVKLSGNLSVNGSNVEITEDMKQQIIELSLSRLNKSLKITPNMTPAYS